MKNLFKKMFSGVLVALLMVLPLVGCVAPSLNEADIVESLSAQPKNETDTASSWYISSPDNTVAGLIELDGNGKASYTVKRGDETIVLKSDLGLVTKVDGETIDYSSGLSFKAVTTAIEVNEKYSMVGKRNDENTNHYFERVLTLSKDGYDFVIAMRAYDDGFAFRYRISKDGANSSAMSIISEGTTYTVPSSSKVWAMTYHTGWWYCYEENYSETTIENLKTTMINAKRAKEEDKNPEGIAAMPLLYKTVGGSYAILAQADITGEYVGCFLKPEGNNVLSFAYPTRQVSDVSTRLKFESPWRVVITGDLLDIYNSNMIDNLAKAPDPKYDFSWVQPGKGIWSWIADSTEYEDKKAQQGDKERIKKYIRLAADLNAYYVLDEGWQPNSKVSGEMYAGYFDWFDEIADYAKSLNVGLIAWVPYPDMKTKAQRDARFPEWRKKGIVGLKPDFFDSDDQEIMRVYEDILKETAELKMVLNWHNVNPNYGDGRTWPHSLSREAMRGQEHYGLTAKQYTILPFSRMVMGGADATESPTAMTEQVTSSFQTALSIVAFAPFHSLAGNADVYAIHPALEMFRSMPAVWNETKLLEGEVGELISVARRTNNNWYLGAISVAKRDLDFELDFLKEGITYDAVVYKDSPYDQYGVAAEKIKVQKGDTITVRIVANSGCAIMITDPTAKVETPPKKGCKSNNTGAVVLLFPALLAGLVAIKLTKHE